MAATKITAPQNVLCSLLELITPTGKYAAMIGYSLVRDVIIP